LAICLFRVTVRISHKETPCIHEVNENHINQGQIMQCIITYATGMYLYLSNISSEIHIFNSEHLASGHHIYVSKDVRIRGCFSKP